MPSPSGDRGPGFEFYLSAGPSMGGWGSKLHAPYLPVHGECCGFTWFLLLGQVQGKHRAWKKEVGSSGFCWQRQKTQQNWEDGMCKRHLSMHCFCASAWPMVSCLPAQCLLSVSWSPVPFSLIFSFFPASHPITTGSTEPLCHPLMSQHIL